MDERYVVMLNEKLFIKEDKDVYRNKTIQNYEAEKDLSQATKYDTLKEANKVANEFGGKVYQIDLN